MPLPLKPEVEDRYIFCKTEVHADTRTFLNHYLLRHVDIDIQSVINGRESNKSLMRVITRMSRWIDTRRPRHLTTEQRASIYEHPEYVKAVRRLEEQTEIYIYDLSKQIRSRRNTLARDKLNMFSRLERALIQANIDIKRQLSRAAIDDEEAKDSLRIDSMLLE
ncbi:hypothetical protein N7474_008598 [Penicillium riverlandense]|uniref:uncharacterized protein n=1 Tax=Penicillium riverlandense TaxID=1903569 RepID=UPI0025472CE2|nr:uncharacterized protein N7474_008598 [Penicillium riverlandense]KAJ5812297.1 hypothetical protein N7474_008598 [Penicillium riverlandense]